jgi:undecaprenyl-diphosphatase
MGVLGLLLILAIVQGLTEFLPVSSSGHLVLGRSYLPGGEQLAADARVEVLLHVGTLIAVLFYYRREIFALMAGAVGQGPAPASQRRLLGMLLLGSIPAAVIGLGFEHQLEALFAAPVYAAAFLLVTGTFLWFSRKLPEGRRELADLSTRTALLIGLAQAVAILPGISRSGSTIVAGLALGLTSPAAATFSFLLSIPAVGGAILLRIGDLIDFTASEPLAAAAGVAVTAVVGLAALGLLVWLGRSRRLWWFAPYCWVLGAVGLALAAFN